MWLKYVLQVEGWKLWTDNLTSPLCIHLIRSLQKVCIINGAINNKYSQLGNQTMIMRCLREARTLFPRILYLFKGSLYMPSERFKCSRIWKCVVWLFKYQHFGETCCLHLQDRQKRRTVRETAGPSQQLVPICLMAVLYSHINCHKLFLQRKREICCLKQSTDKITIVCTSVPRLYSILLHGLPFGFYIHFHVYCANKTVFSPYQYFMLCRYESTAPHTLNLATTWRSSSAHCQPAISITQLQRSHFGYDAQCLCWVLNPRHWIISVPELHL
jgi:hypothetical protein